MLAAKQLHTLTLYGSIYYLLYSCFNICIQAFHSLHKGSTNNDLGGGENREKKISRALLQEKKFKKASARKKIHVQYFLRPSDH